MTDDDVTVSQEKAGALTRPVIRWGSSSEIDRSFELMFMFSLLLRHIQTSLYDKCIRQLLYSHGIVAFKNGGLPRALIPFS